MYPVSSDFLSAIRAGHVIVVKATAYRAGAVVTGAEDLIVVDGGVRVDSSSVVQRTLDGLRLASPDGSSATLRELLDVASTELQLWRGVRYPSGRVELAPIGRFRVDNVDDDLVQDGAVTVTGHDLMARIVDDRFLTPRSVTPGTGVVAEITALIQETIPGALVLDHTGATDLIPAGVVWERERADALAELATSISATVFADPEGHFSINPIPTLQAPAVWTVNAGSNAVLLGGSRTSTRDGVYNVVVVSSSPTDGSDPVWAMAQDDNAASPTYVTGPYGRVPRFVSSPLFTTGAQAQAAADAQLARSLGRRDTLALTSMVNPALTAGDRIDVVLPDGSLQPVIVDGLTVPLTPDGVMPIQVRQAPAASVEESV